MNHANNNNNDHLNLALQPSSSGGPNGYRYKGVVPQPNGHWGAQIYANHQRVWLGTFKTERDAAMAYDSAAIKLRSSESYRNLPISPSHLALEAGFQSHFSEEAVLSMIKEGSYQSKLAEFCRSWQSHPDPAGLLSHHYPGGVMKLGGGNDILYKDYFEKELTPSDVGKLNRLVIPKKYAVKFFPQVSHVEPDDFGNGGEITDAELDFFDRAMKRWTFRYCYWKSSQSFVFTKGWNKFVKEKGLKTKDVVLFYNCEMRPKPGVRGDVTFFSLIDFRQCEPEVGERADGAGPSGAVDEAGQEDVDEEENVNVEGEGERRVLRLFGVDIM